MGVVIKSNIKHSNLTVNSGGAKKASISICKTVKEIHIKAMLYPNITIIKNQGDSHDFDGLIKGATFTDYYNLAKN